MLAFTVYFLDSDDFDSIDNLIGILDIQANSLGKSSIIVRIKTNTQFSSMSINPAVMSHKMFKLHVCYSLSVQLSLFCRSWSVLNSKSFFVSFCFFWNSLQKSLSMWSILSHTHARAEYEYFFLHNERRTLFFRQMKWFVGNYSVWSFEKSVCVWEREKEKKQ